MTDKILEVRGLTKTYGGEKKPGAKLPTPTLDVLKGIDIDIYRGDVVCLIGPSGCGKSTFLRCLNRLEIPTCGSIKFEGRGGGRSPHRRCAPEDGHGVPALQPLPPPDREEEPGIGPAACSS